MNPVRFSAVVDFEMSPDEAVAILADPQPSYMLACWLTKHYPVEEKVVWTDGFLDHNARQLKEKLGENRVAQMIAERKQLGSGVIEVGKAET